MICTSGTLDECWVVLAPNGRPMGDDDCRDGRPKFYGSRIGAELSAKVFSGESVTRYGEYRRQAAIDLAVRRGFASLGRKPSIPMEMERCGCTSCQAAWSNLHGYIAATIRAEFSKIWDGGA